jgi:hypothetical protein
MRSLFAPAGFGILQRERIEYTGPARGLAGQNEIADRAKNRASSPAPPPAIAWRRGGRWWRRSNVRASVMPDLEFCKLNGSRTPARRAGWRGNSELQIL